MSSQESKGWSQSVYNELNRMCKEGDEKALEQFLEKRAVKEKGVWINRLDVVLDWACIHGQLNVVRHLLLNKHINAQGGLCLNKKEEERGVGDRESRLCWASMSGNVELVKYMTSSLELKIAGQEWASLETGGGSALVMACKEGHVEVVKYLTSGAELQAVGQGWVPLHRYEDEVWMWACKEGHVEIVKYLTSSETLKAAGQSWLDVNGFTGSAYLQDACDGGRWEVLEWCILGLPEERALSLKGGGRALARYERVQEFERIREEQKVLTGFCVQTMKNQGQGFEEKEVEKKKQGGSENAKEGIKKGKRL